MLVELTRTELLHQAHENFVAAYRVIAEAAPHGATTTFDGATACATGIPEVEFNRLFVTAPPADPPGMLSQATAFFRTHNVPWMLVAAPELATAIGPAAVAAGLHYGRSMPGMLLAPLREPARSVPGLEVERVTSAGLAEIFVGALAAGLGMPSDMMSVFGTTGAWDTAETESFIGWLDGHAVGTATLVLSDDMAGVYNVTTALGWRDRGIATAMTEAAVALGAARGAVASTLQASSMGFPVYRRMGYEPIGSYRGWYRRKP